MLPSSLFRDFFMDSNPFESPKFFRGTAADLKVCCNACVRLIVLPQESEAQYVLQMDVPGLTKNDVDINLAGRRVCVTAKFADTDESDRDNYWYHCRERMSAGGRVTRCFEMQDATTNESDIAASMNNGVLTVTIPKQAATPTPLGSKIHIA
eukprot:TRINITY_DN40553_c0_g1_i2.p1 TRINITY_DN40553_c0_g1~~TRINITY_DN40553_c0_g1_i2.p1  ORF type:complete len:152 (+),score=2.50 TRINITY_DN40553_c0_g1_i2:72-527(+)